MPRLPHSWLGRIFAVLALVLVALDALTLVGSPAYRQRGLTRRQGTIVALAGGTLRVTTGQFITATEGFSWGSRWSRVWLPRGGNRASPIGGRVVRLTLPLWIVWVPLALAAWRFDRRFMVRWRQPGQCLECGYDMNGLPEAAVCPECGAGRGRA